MNCWEAHAMGYEASINLLGVLSDDLWEYKTFNHKIGGPLIILPLTMIMIL